MFYLVDDTNEDQPLYIRPRPRDDHRDPGCRLTTLDYEAGSFATQREAEDALQEYYRHQRSSGSKVPAGFFSIMRCE